MRSKSDQEPDSADCAHNPANQNQNDSRQQSASKMPTIESSQAQSKTDNDKKRWYKDRRFLLGCGVFIATSLAAVFTFYQAWIARDTAKRQLRAYVIVSSKHIPKLQEGIKPFIESTIDNVGQ